MGLFGIMCRKLRRWVFWRHATARLRVGTIVVSELWITSCNVGINCQPYTNTLTSCPNHVIGVNKMEEFWIGRTTFKSHSGIKLLDVWGFGFMDPFVSYHWMKYVLLVVDYLSKWVEVIVLPNNEVKSFITLLKKIPSSELAHLGPLLRMVALTFVLCFSNGYWKIWVSP